MLTGSDLVNEEGGGCASEAKAQSLGRPDSSAEGCATSSLAIPSTDRTDLTELDLPATMKTHFPDPADLLNFQLTIVPDDGTPSRAQDRTDPRRHVQGRLVPLHVYH